jgi:tetratricopeptide (TPR) repeat protein
MEPFLAEIDQLLAAGEYDRALALVRSFEHSYPVRYEVGMAALAAHRGDAADCLAHAERAYLLVPNDAVVVQHMAIAGDAATAERYAREAVDRDGSLRSLGGLANVLYGAGKAKEAEAVFRRMLEKDPHHLQALNGLGTCRFRQGDAGGALETWARAFDENPADLTPIKSLMNMYAEAGRVLGALAAAGLARDQGHGDVQTVALDMTMLQLTRVLLDDLPGPRSVSEVDEVTAALMASCASRPARVKLAAARSLYDCKRYDEVRRLLADAEAQDLTDADRGLLNYLKGLFAEREGDVDRALGYYTLSVEADGRRWESCCNALAFLLARPDDASLAEAAQLLRRVPAELRLQPALLVNEALYFRRAGRDADARTHLQRVMALTGGQGDIAAFARQVLAEMGPG